MRHGPGSVEGVQAGRATVPGARTPRPPGRCPQPVSGTSRRPGRSVMDGSTEHTAACHLRKINTSLVQTHAAQNCYVVHINAAISVRNGAMDVLIIEYRPYLNLQ